MLTRPQLQSIYYEQRTTQELPCNHLDMSHKLSEQEQRRLRHRVNGRPWRPCTMHLCSHSQRDNQHTGAGFAVLGVSLCEHRKELLDQRAGGQHTDTSLPTVYRGLSPLAILPLALLLMMQGVCRHSSTARCHAHLLPWCLACCWCCCWTGSRHARAAWLGRRREAPARAAGAGGPAPLQRSPPCSGTP